MDRVLALHPGSRGFDSHQGHLSERFFRSNRPRYPHPVSSELENSGIRVVVCDCSVTDRWPGFSLTPYLEYFTPILGLGTPVFQGISSILHCVLLLFPKNVWDSYFQNPSENPGWWLVIAVSLNVGGGVHLIKPVKLIMCMQNTTNTTRTWNWVCAAIVPYC